MWQLDSFTEGFQLRCIADVLCKCLFKCQSQVRSKLVIPHTITQTNTTNTKSLEWNVQFAVLKRSKLVQKVVEKVSLHHSMVLTGSSVPMTVWNSWTVRNSLTACREVEGHPYIAHILSYHHNHHHHHYHNHRHHHQNHRHRHHCHDEGSAHVLHDAREPGHFSQ